MVSRTCCFSHGSAHLSYEHAGRGRIGGGRDPYTSSTRDEEAHAVRCTVRSSACIACPALWVALSQFALSSKIRRQTSAQFQQCLNNELFSSPPISQRPRAFDNTSCTRTKLCCYRTSALTSSEQLTGRAVYVARPADQLLPPTASAGPVPCARCSRMPLGG